MISIPNSNLSNSLAGCAKANPGLCAQSAGNNSFLNQGCRRCSHTISCSFSPNASSGVDLDKKFLKKDHDLLKKTDIRPRCHRIQTSMAHLHGPSIKFHADEQRFIPFPYQSEKVVLDKNSSRCVLVWTFWCCALR